MYIGIDPDLHDLAIGYWQDGPRGADVVHVKRTKGVVGQAAVVQMVKAMWDLPVLLRVKGQPHGIAIEAQTLRRSGPKQHKRPEDIVVLGNVAGAALALAAPMVNPDYLHFPTPEEWKGQIPKHVMQARLYSDLGWGYEIIGKDEHGQSGKYARPLRPTPEFNHISSGQWKHVGDALLLAKWASTPIDER